MTNALVTSERVRSSEQRREALEILRQVFVDEKRWLPGPAAEIPPSPGALADRSWFLARVHGEAAGLFRLVYDPPLEAPPELELRYDPGFDPDRLRQGCLFAEIGRFMILHRHRRRFGVALSLMKAALREVVERGYTHLLTDVFEEDPPLTSPLPCPRPRLQAHRHPSPRRAALRQRSHPPALGHRPRLPSAEGTQA